MFSRIEQQYRGSTAVVIYPADGQKDVPLAYHAGERPDPIPESADKKAGYPVSVAFPRTATEVTHLRDCPTCRPHWAAWSAAKMLFLRFKPDSRQSV